jgi:small subunit ribosomal protein S16
VGRKKVPLYRIVIAEQTAPRDGRFIDIIGTYDPKGKTQQDKVQLDLDKAKDWVKRGATPTDTVAVLLTKAGVIQGA